MFSFTLCLNGHGESVILYVEALKRFLNTDNFMADMVTLIGDDNHDATA